MAGSTAPAFGAPSALGGAPAFGAASALGGGAPAFGAASAPAFGAASALGGAPAFGAASPSGSAFGELPALLAQNCCTHLTASCVAPSPRCWCTTVGIGFWRTLSTWRRISFRYVRVSAVHHSSPRAHTARVFCSHAGGTGAFGAAQGGGAFGAAQGGGGGFASYAPQAASSGFGALAQAGGSAPAPSFGGHR